MSFVHLHNHSHYSLLDGAAKIGEMVKRTGELGMTSLALTDHGNMFGVLEFYTHAVNAGIKPIIGMEAYIAPRSRDYRKSIEGEANSYHIVLLAKNEQGFKNLIKLSSIAYLEGIYYKPRIDKKVLRQYSEGLIATSACMSGEIAYKLKHGMREQAIKVAEDYLDIFGDDFYFEIQNHHIPEEAAVYPKIYELAKEMGVPVIATNDNHYLRKGDHEAHDILLCLQTGNDRDDPNRMRYNTEELYLKSPEEMYTLFKDKPEVCETTNEIAEKINLEIKFGEHLLPKFPIPESEGDISIDEYLSRLTSRGAEKRYGNIDERIQKRMDYELSVIEKMGYAGYFLIVQDFINAARERDIPVGLGRGSAAGSIVAYNLGITNVDPLRYDLLFERFLNPDRISMPDIDVDFCMDRRDEVIEYVRDKYGRKNVAQIITFGTMASRGVIRDVARVLKIPIADADKIAKMIPFKGAKPLPLKKAFEEVPELKELKESDDPLYGELIRYSQTLEGIARHASVHAAGIIITPDDITNYAPLYKSSDGEVTTQWTMGWSEAVGLLKMDFLGLRNLTVIQKTEQMISKKLDRKFSVAEQPLDDEETYKLFGDGLTVGVFQFESSGMQEYLRKLKPSRIEDLIAMNALYRPGPMKYIDDFIDRKYGRKTITYPHPKQEPILKETYGIIVYQEQVMRIASELAGFTMAQADILRKIMGKKDKKKMPGQINKFIKGCMDNGIDKKTAEEISVQLVTFAEYGFNKSHSAAYAIIAYQTAFLKKHYPAEFMSANLTSEVNNSDRVMILMEECKKLGLTIQPPDVNYSIADFRPLNDKTIAFGMKAIKNVGSGAIESIVAAREQRDGKFANIFELMQDADLSKVNKKVLESLIQAGAMDTLEGNRAQLYNAIESAIEFGQSYQGSKKRDRNQRSIFDLSAEDDDFNIKISYPALTDVPDWPVTEKLKKERELLGFYISGHPLNRYKTIVDLFATDIDRFINAEEKETEDKESQAPSMLNICGQVIDIRFIQDKKNERMAFIKVEDFKRTYDVVVFSSVYAECKLFLQSDSIIFLNGRRDSDLDEISIKIIAKKVLPIEKVPEVMTDSILLVIDKNNFSGDDIPALKSALKSSPGRSDVYFQLPANGSPPYRLLSNAYRLKLTHRTLGALSKIVGSDNIKIKVSDR